MGSPRAVRAVASACARNPVTFIVPCHRIVRKGGGLGGDYWGLDMKRELLERET
jgi:O-6-methylguanine DNA methyltransferase